ncbi:MAG TPA: hypothetical protein EYP67_07890 [Methanosarcinales archaeon]|nr:hypothetical protein [Methanosarcinales archaeon]
MVVESTDEITRSADRFIESEMIISRGFMVSAQRMFGDGYKAIIRNLSHEYGKSIIEYLAAGTDLTALNDIEKLQLLFERGVCADDVKVAIEDDKLILTTMNCRHHLGKYVRERTGIPSTRVCPVGILATCLIQNIISQNVRGGRKDAENYEKTGECVIRFDLTEK